MDGYDVLEYVGPSYGTQTFWVENTAYRFGLNQPLGYVAKEHTDIMLRMSSKQGNRLFVKVELVEEEPEPEPVKEAETVEPVEEEVTMETVEEPSHAHTELTVDEEPLDPSEMTVTEIKNLDLTPDEAMVLLEKERMGKDRVTATSYLEDVLYGG